MLFGVKRARDDARPVLVQELDERFVILGFVIDRSGNAQQFCY